MPADPDKIYFKRDVALIVKGFKDELKKEKPVEEHIYSVLMESKTYFSICNITTVCDESTRQIR